MKNTIYGVVGKGKLGSLLLGRSGFVYLPGDITSLDQVKLMRSNFPNVDVVVNCAALSSIDTCEADPHLASEVNVRGTMNLVEVFGSRVLSISSDQVFGGGWVLPKENSNYSPINVYGMTKAVAEQITNGAGAKTIRLSRTVDLRDSDMGIIYDKLREHRDIAVPTFFYRNYLTRSQAVDGIEYAAKHFNTLPSVVNYGGLDNVSMYELVRRVFQKYLPLHSLHKQTKYDSNLSPRPKRGGFNVSLAKKLGFPMYNLDDVVGGL